MTRLQIADFNMKELKKTDLVSDADFLTSFGDDHMKALLLASSGEITHEEADNLHNMLNAKDVESAKLGNIIIAKIIDKMEQSEINKRNQAISVYMGGPVTLREALGRYSDAEFDFEKLTDLKFHISWDWLIPVWKKVRHELTPTMIITAISCIDENEIDKLYILLSQVCINWCKSNNIKLE